MTFQPVNGPPAGLVQARRGQMDLEDPAELAEMSLDFLKRLDFHEIVRPREDECHRPPFVPREAGTVRRTHS